jgi:hypothetical protein
MDSTASRLRVDHPRRWPPDSLESVLLDPSLFVSPRTLRVLDSEFVRRFDGVKVLVPSSLLVALSELTREQTVPPFWRFWGGRRGGLTPRASASVAIDLLESRGVRPYHVGDERTRESAMFGFRGSLPKGYARNETTSRILFEELEYLRSHSIILGRSRRPYDALVAAGSIVMQFGERHLPPDVIEKLRKLGWRRIFTKVGIGAAITASAVALGPLVVLGVGPLNTLVGLMDP